MFLLLLLLIAAIVSVGVGQVLDIEINEGQVSFFEYDLPEEGMTISVHRQEGGMTLFASDKIRNPNSAFFDYRIVNEGEIYIPSSSLIQKRELTENPLNVTLYVSVQGTGKTNIFQLFTAEGDTTNGKFS